MKLYHYSTIKLNELKSLYARGLEKEGFMRDGRVVSKTILIEVVIKGPFKGSKFLVKRRKELERFKLKILTTRNGGFANPVIYKSRTLKCSLATREDIKKYINLSNETKDLQDYILDITHNPLKVFKLGYNTLNDLLTPFEIEVYNHLPPSGTWVLENALNKKLKEDSDYEIFAPLRYWKFIENKQCRGSVYIESDKVLISNLGRVVSLQKDLNPNKHDSTEERYFEFNLSFDNKSQPVKLHRALGCVFITPKNNVENLPLTRLTINHIDTNRYNNKLANLEWITHVENLKHAQKSGLFKGLSRLDNTRTLPMVGEVVIPGKYLGLKFVVFGVRHAIKFGLRISNRFMYGGDQPVKGCVFTEVNRDEISKHKVIDDLDDDTLVYLRKTVYEKIKESKTMGYVAEVPIKVEQSSKITF